MTENLPDPSCHVPQETAPRAMADPPPAPGDVLLYEFMVPAALSTSALALALRVPVTRIEGILWQKRAMSPETAIRLARYFGTSAEYWMELEAAYALHAARDAAGPAIARDVQPRPGQNADAGTDRAPRNR
ncbi:HigA family addiction module antitoxin [Cupriavidus sp. SZY C1]|uniref:HigA family addiction module antitoxin n=1 Tax=Cupriavidus sp. SZY C1 TaxID=3055037 RepID=UPI0028B2A68A|nr:HigA family addiction module antitoxin [Cupriavidus sp. SZY C1]MDT6961321.1 HigA family addiction module antitoxin [Cupriavidus sp. SZY C1]